MPEKMMFLVRDGRGRMRTLIGFSTKGVVRDYLEQYPTESGEVLEVKPRGGGSWEAFKVS
jgi:hypothetical protein